MNRARCGDKHTISVMPIPEQEERESARNRIAPAQGVLNYSCEATETAK